MPDRLLLLRSKFKNIIGQHPRLFYLLYNLKALNRKLSVHKSTQLVIEGFPRCANTFAVLTFQWFNPNVKVAHHLHVPAQVFRAVQWKIPTLVLIRPPKETVTSLVIRHPQLPIITVLKSYISFYRSIQDYSGGYIVGVFDEIVNDYSKIILKVNRKFHTKFAAITPNHEIKTRIFSQIGEVDRIFAKNPESKVLQSCKPQIVKEDYKENIYNKIMCNYGNELKIAETIYQDFQKLT